MRKYLIAVFLICLAVAAVRAQLFGNKGSMQVYDWSLSYTPGTPPNLGAPSNAAIAGFTTNVLKANFAAGGTLTIGGAAPIANTPTRGYITNCGAAASQPNSPSSWHFDFYQDTLSGQTILPCGVDATTSGTIITTDAANGNIQVLEETLTASDNNANTKGSGAYLSFPRHIQGTGGWLPQELYTKVVYRVDTGTIDQSPPFGQNGGVYGGPTWWSQNVTFPNNTYVDQDWAQQIFFPNNSCGVSNQWFYGFFQEAPSGQTSAQICVQVSDFTAYHTLEVLVTSDERTNMTMCLWFDGARATPNNCSPRSMQSASIYTLHDRSVYMSLSIIPNHSVATNNLHVYIQSIEIWDCANYATTGCPGSTLFGPDANGLEYWH